SRRPQGLDPRRGARRVRRARLPGHVHRGHREARGNLPAVSLPPLRDEEGALHRLGRPLLPRHAGALPARRRGPAGRGGPEGDRRGLHGAAGDRPDVAARPDAGLRGLGGPGHPPRRPRGLRRPDRLRPPRQRRRLAHDLAVLRDGDAPERARLDARHRQPGALDERAARGLRQGPVSRFFFTTEVVMTHNRNKATTYWTLAITSIALFMVSLDNLVVTTALPVIRRYLHATISQLEWTVNAYTLTFAVLLLTGAALGDRFGRRRMFSLGLLLFTGASAFAALSTSADALDIARAVQGVGGAIITPLTLTILSAAVAPERRGLALGIWGGVGGLAIALGPLVGGAIVSGVSLHWIFWVNVPIGLVLAPLAARYLEESHGPDAGLDLPGVGLVSIGLLGIVWGLVRGNEHGWTSAGVVVPMVVGALLVAAFVL